MFFLYPVFLLLNLCLFSQMQTYGFEDPDFVPKDVYADFQKSYEVVLKRRYARWKLVIDQDSLVRGFQLKRFCRKGVPAEFRSHVWMTLSGAYEEMRQNPTVYQVASKAEPPKKIFTAIMADLPRTFPENAHFSQAQGKGDKLQALQRILVAFAVTFPNIGYCQGLNYVAATLLLALSGPLEEVEEKTFWLLHALTHKIVPNYYGNRMIDVQVDCLVFEELLRMKAPPIYNTLKSANVDCIVLATKWFICLFTDVVPIETVLRIFDCLFYEGDKILFRACIALAKLHTKEIVACQQFPDVVLTFRDITQDKQTLYCHEFLKAMFTLPGSLSKARIRKLRAKCLTQVMATMDELDAREREYKAKVTAQQKVDTSNTENVDDGEYDSDDDASKTPPQDGDDVESSSSVDIRKACVNNSDS
ncbi:unnamed protein product [Mesocestoides corti]|uniref:Growth hormone-regulated TBC protein 1 n=2 Tax=Mesocestoides corti TaxID=53468 RepID=A0A158QVB6_MESCO|nr:unnamed protein product [Mesocestoides corti]